MNPSVKFVRMNGDARIPAYAHAGDSGMDLYATEDVVLPPTAFIKNSFIKDYSDGMLVKHYYPVPDRSEPINTNGARAVPTGLGIILPEGYEAQVRPKSGLAIKQGITVLNTPGTVDRGFQGEIQVIMINLSAREYLVKAGSKVAQLVICPVAYCNVEEAKDFTEVTSRGEGGFGSTGI